MTGDDTYKMVDGDDVVTESPDDADTEDIHEGGVDTVMYSLVKAENDDSQTGITETTPANVETVLGTQYDDTLTAGSGAAVLGLEGDDRLNGSAGDDTLVGCAGENTLMGNDRSRCFRCFHG